MAPRQPPRHTSPASERALAHDGRTFWPVPGSTPPAPWRVGRRRSLPNGTPSQSGCTPTYTRQRARPPGAPVGIIDFSTWGSANPRAIPRRRTLWGLPNGVVSGRAANRRRDAAPGPWVGRGVRYARAGLFGSVGDAMAQGYTASPKQWQTRGSSRHGERRPSAARHADERSPGT